MRFKAVIFDLGDTLILTDRWDYDKCLKKLLSSLKNDSIMIKIPFEEFKRGYFKVREKMYLKSEPALREVDFRSRIAITLKIFLHYSIYEGPILTHAIDAFFDAFIEDAYTETYVSDLLLELKKEYKLGLASNFASPQGFWRVLEHFDLGKFFNTIVVSGEVGFRKPHPIVFKNVLEGLNMKPTETVFVGDSLKADIFGAKILGLKTILIENPGMRKNPYAIAGELDPFPVEPDARIPNLKELPRALSNIV
ncbi:MAG: HAD family hydrolase [Candidatus Bathyarchaeota archaeon]|nr:MAG: HAD family hydrolase [Candidatus Bathyarchaeota archaeon]